MDVYLSNPAVFCAAGTNSAEFLRTLVSGSQSGITKSACGAKDFFVAKIGGTLDERPGGFGWGGTRLAQILSSCVGLIRPEIERAVELYGRKKVGVCVGSCDNGSALSLRAHESFFKRGAFPEEYDLSMQGAQAPAAFISELFGIEGISLAFSTACASSASALSKAKELIECGAADAVVAGGVDIASPTVLLGFDSLGAVSKGVSSPFSKNRDGITLGEGAAFFVLSRDDIASTRIVLKGAGESSDAHHLTAPDPSGKGALQAMADALSDANLRAGDIGYINLHGTGTLLNDSMEARAVSALFGGSVPISSTKPLTGHTLGAAGAIELAACFLALESGECPVHVSYGEKDESLPPLDFVSAGRAAGEIRNCMTNSFAFGGCNVSLVIGKKA